MNTVPTDCSAKFTVCIRSDVYITFAAAYALVEEHLVFQSFKMLLNEGFSLGFLVNRFTMVEENFEFHRSQMLQMEDFH